MSRLARMSPDQRNDAHGESAGLLERAIAHLVVLAENDRDASYCDPELAALLCALASRGWGEDLRTLANEMRRRAAADAAMVAKSDYYKHPLGCAREAGRRE